MWMRIGDEQWLEATVWGLGGDEEGDKWVGG